jgi:hypothetical protein
VTLESFTEWKKHRMDKKDAEEAVKRKLKEKQWSAGKSQGMSGRDLFEFNPDWAEDSEEEEGDYFDLSTYDRDEAEKERDRLANERREVENGVAEMSINDEEANAENDEAESSAN